MLLHAENIIFALQKACFRMSKTWVLWAEKHVFGFQEEPTLKQMC